MIGALRRSRSGANPYVGPRAIVRGEYFFGREPEERQLIQLLVPERIVLVHAPSGAGKTSLIQAGVLPTLEKEGFTTWMPAQVSGVDEPTEGENRYARSVIQSFEEQFDKSDRIPLKQLAGLSLDQYFDGRLSADELHVLVFDQFEEILTLDRTDHEAKHQFFLELAKVLKDRNRWAIFAMREEWLGALRKYRRLLPTRLAAQFRLELLGREGALRAVMMPAEESGRPFKKEAAESLVDDLRKSTRPGEEGTEPVLAPFVEPVQLQVACRRIWQQTDGHRDITLRDLESVGDVDSALAGYYGRAIRDALEAAKEADGPTPREREVRDWFQTELIQDGIRTQTQARPGDSQVVLHSLEESHLVRAQERQGVLWYELSHDRMIGPLTSSNHQWSKEYLESWQQAAIAWSESRQNAAAWLLRGPELKSVEQRHGPVTENGWTATEAAFIKSSRQACQRRKRIAIGLAGSVALLLVATVFSAFQWETANDARQAALEASAESERQRLDAVEAQVARETAEDDLRQAEQLTAEIEAAVSSLIAGGAIVPVPDVSESSDPVRLLEALGFTPVINEAFNPSVPAGQALGQTPPPGTEAETGSEVQVLISAGPRRVIAFDSDQDGDRDIYIMDVDGETILMLTDDIAGPANDTDPAWSPDGSLIAFVSDRDGDPEIFVMSANGTDVVQLTNNAIDDGDPAWSPDGMKLAFRSFAGGNADIHVMASDGSDQIKLTDDPAEDARPYWSPDGSRIVFDSDRYGNFDLFVMEADGSNVTQLTETPSDEVGAVWSPDGSSYAYTSDTTGRSDIYIMDVDGSNIRHVTATVQLELSPVWAPDGSGLAYLSEQSGFHIIQTIDLTTNEIVHLTSPTFSSRNPSWSMAAETSDFEQVAED